MKKILLISYYGFNESLKCAKESLEKLGYILDDYPLFRYAYDKHDKLDNYMQHFENYISDTSPDIILWWFIGIAAKNIQYIREKFKDIFSIMFSWDDPYIWSDKASEIADKCSCFDLVVSCCEDTIEYYIKNGSKYAIFSPPGYDPKINYPIEVNDEDYLCDISICCTNLYKDSNIYPEQYVNRKQLMDEIVACKDFKTMLYGPETLKIYYPENYGGFIKYNDLNQIYNKSRINLCTHVCCNNSKYINERSILILGSGALLMVDPIKDLNKLIAEDECVYFNKENIIDQIKEILHNYDKYKQVKLNGLNRSKDYTWDKWAEKIHDFYCNLNFDSKFYTKLYSLDDLTKNNINRKEEEYLLKEYWRNTGKSLNHIPFKFEVPKNFDYMKYSQDTNIPNSNREYLYWHYTFNYKRNDSQNDNNDDGYNPYIIDNGDTNRENKDCKSLSKMLDELHMDFNSWIEINKSFSKISEGKNISENLINIKDIVKKNPYCDINSTLKYFMTNNNC